MGILRDALGSALGAGDVKNGFNGPQIPFVNGRNQQSRRSSSMQPSRTGSPQPPDPKDQMIPAISRPKSQNSSYGMTQSGYDFRFQEPQNIECRFSANPNDFHELQERQTAASNGDPPPYAAVASERVHNNDLSYRTQGYYNDIGFGGRFHQQGSSHHTFRPVALPTTTYGDGQPFLRGYSSDLQHYNIPRSEFIFIVDAINTAIMPNPEMQIFQKGASIAGWFLPGAASLGLMGGQIAAGVGGAYFHVATVNKVLAKANLDVFVPQGLEICIGSSKDLDKEVGFQQTPLQLQYSASPEARLIAYGDLLAPIDEVSPAAERQGRNDPIALLGRGLAKKTDGRKLKKAQEDLAEGEAKKMTKLEGTMKWLIVRRASQQAVNAWQKVLQQSNAELADMQSSGQVRA